MAQYALTYSINGDYYSAQHAFKFMFDQEHLDPPVVIRDTHMAYALHLYIWKKYNFAQKEFIFCLKKLRQTDSYCHFYYSKSLLHLKQFKLSLYHLILAKKLNPHLVVWKENNNGFVRRLTILMNKGIDYRSYVNCNCNQNSTKKSKRRIVCAGCKAAPYCNRKCQKQDWNRHNQQRIYSFGCIQIRFEQCQVY